MPYQSWYHSNFDARLEGRYITLEHIRPILESYKNDFEITVAGVSELKKDIHLVKVGSGKKIVLAWSQMHGNESTTTKAVLDFLKLIQQKEVFQRSIKDFLSTYTLFLVPMLNPDGAQLYTRENGNKVDLNRDATILKESESRVLRNLFIKYSPDLCLNLHDQRSIYGLETGKPATISFLSPSADKKGTMTLPRKIAMTHIATMAESLKKYIPGQVGRYDDTFNINCVGDAFQNAGVPTILFEAGHYEQDYQRERSREFIFYSLLSLFNMSRINTEIKSTDYFKIPENTTNYRDYIIRNVFIGSDKTLISIAIQYMEILKDDKVIFKPILNTINKLDEYTGHIDMDGNGTQILVNSQENIHIGQEIFSIVSKDDSSFVFF